MDNIRVFYEKTGRARYISHLDLYRCVQRTMRRAALPVHYTEGFHPHQYLVFALPLSLGFESSCEVLDFALDESFSFAEIQSRLNAALPMGLHVRQVAAPVHKQTEIAFSDYTVTLSTADPQALTAAVDALLAAEEVLVEKKNKKKQMVSVNLRPSIHACTCEAGENQMLLHLRLPAGTQTNVNPALVCGALAVWQNAPAFTVERVCRTKIICADGTDFF